MSGENNAPAPEVMREEFVTILLNKNPACGRHRAEEIVDSILKKQMEYYSAMAEEELDTSSVQAAVLVQELSGLVTSLIAAGAAVTQYMADQKKWQRLATRTRTCLAQLGGMVG